ncbi:protein cepu-1 [Plakobranchus ocellatus]|uniref:Protein cepu-1 n=1 Tax=Plakobranchus ocellatus TaxID=259542 RepID=A0AAV4D218_9GAST|nr:protein cepu-1 [Plakobranchus ocellatus]
MTTIRSSVRPGQPKLPWGTILKPEFGMGYQKMTEYEIEQAVNRLNSLPAPKEQVYHRPNPKMSQDEIDAMLERLTQMDKSKVRDSDRRVVSSSYREMGVVSSYAWIGYN